MYGWGDDSGEPDRARVVRLSGDGWRGWLAETSRSMLDPGREFDVLPVGQ